MRLWLCVVLCTVACSWSVLALISNYVRVEYRGVTAAVRKGKAYDARELEDAVHAYGTALRMMPCNTPLLHERALLLAQQADNAMAGPEVDAADDALAAAQKGIADILSCTPMDGKAWLDFATITTHREGVSDRALAAFSMSATVSPGESWLAEKRLLFALTFRPLLDAQSLAVVRQDMGTLELAHPNRINAVMKAAKVNSKEALAALFAAPAS